MKKIIVSILVFLFLVSVSGITPVNAQSLQEIRFVGKSITDGGVCSPVGTLAVSVGGALYYCSGTWETVALGDIGTDAISAAQVSTGTFGSASTKGNYRFDAAGNTNPVFFVDATNQRVGVRTASPGDVLTVGTSSSVPANINIGSWVGMHLGQASSAWDGILGHNMRVESNNTFRAAANHASFGYRAITFSYGNSNTDGIKFYTYLGSVTAGDTLSNQRMIIANDGNVGIGTTGPGAPLHVHQATGGEGIRISAPTGQRTDFNLFRGTTQQFRIMGWTDGNTYVDFESGRNFFIRSGFSGNPFVTFTSNGNVGIGTTDPGAKFHVIGQARTSNVDGSYLVPTAETHLTPKRYVDETINQQIIEQVDSSKWTQSGNNIYNENSGNVGIGTTSPNAKLHVDGFARGNYLTPTSDYHFTPKHYVDNNFVSTTDSITGSGTANYVARWTGTKSLGNSVIQDNGTRVGIGTSPHGSYMLQVAGDLLLTSGWLRTTGDTGWYNQTHGGGWYMIDSTWIRTYNNKSIYQESGTMRTDGTFQVGSAGGTLNVANNGNLAYRTNVLFANTSNNVGVGTSSPGAKLHVAGEILVGSYSASTHAVPKSYIDSNFAPIGSALPSGTSGQTLRHTGTAWQANSVLFNNGTNVGIGTTTVGARLTLADHTTNTGGIRFRTASTAVDLYSRASAILTTAANFEAGSYRVGTTEVISSGRVHIAADGSAGTPAFRFSAQNGVGMYRAASNVLAFSTAGTERIRVDASGYVGVGMNNPGARLIVQTTGFSSGFGGACCNDYIAGFKNTSDMNSYIGVDAVRDTGIRFIQNGTERWSIYRSNSNNSLRIDNMTSDLVTILSGGNVGIGTTSPGEKLEVNGNVLADAYFYSSDIRLKEEIEPLKNGLNGITKLNGISYKINGENRLGFSAQQVEKVYPELVKRGENGYLTLDAVGLIAPLVEAIKEQQREIEKLIKEVGELRRNIDAVGIR